jgi:hypothetical protein
MKMTILKAVLGALAFLACGVASADFGVGLKAGTLGIGFEGRWNALPWLDVRMGVNGYDYDDDGSQAGINYNATFALDTYYATGNFRFPLSPFRLTAGAFSNGNEFRMASKDTGGTDFDIGNGTFSPADVGTLRSVTSFSSTAPYLGVGYDFEILGKVGLNLDFGVLWQGEPSVTLEASGLESAPQAVQDQLVPALEIERTELEDEMSDFKAWPVVSLGFIYNF